MKRIRKSETNSRPTIWNATLGEMQRKQCRKFCAVFVASVAAFLLLSESASAAAWIQTTSPAEKTNSRCSRSRTSHCNRPHRPHGLPHKTMLQLTSRQEPSPDERGATSIKKRRELEFKEFVDSNKDDLDSLRAQAAKLREEAASLQSALQESKAAKLQKETNKIDGWIEDLLIQARVGGNGSNGDGDDGESSPETELLKTVDQVCEVLKEDRYSAEQVLKIFKRLCEVREQESRSNCSPLMELLVDATGKLDCTEREENPNKRWNHKVERVLRKKLFARDWNIQYVSDDEQNW